MRSSRLVVVGAFVLTLSSGCVEAVRGPRYVSSADNVVAARALPATPVRLGRFATGTSIDASCQAIELLPADGLSWGDYVRRALVTELVASGTDVAGPVGPNERESSVEGVIEHVDARPSGTLWRIRLLLRSTNGRSLRVEHVHSHPATLPGCEVTREAMVPAVQELVRKVLEHPELPRLLAPAT